MATAPPCGTLRASTTRTRGSPRCSASQSTSTKSARIALRLGSWLSLDGDGRLGEVEALLGFVRDVLADRERRRRGGRGRVAHVYDGLGTLGDEVVDAGAL